MRIAPVGRSPQMAIARPHRQKMMAAPRFGSDKAQPASESPQQPRELTMSEFHILNAMGVAASISTGLAFGEPLLGFLGTLVAPVPLILGYVGIQKLLGRNIKMPKISIAPGFSRNNRK